MEKLKWSELTLFSKGLITAVGISLILVIVYFASPGLRVAVSQSLEFKAVNADNINNVTAGAKLPLPSESVSQSI